MGWILMVSLAANIHNATLSNRTEDFPMHSEQIRTNVCSDPKQQLSDPNNHRKSEPPPDPTCDDPWHGWRSWPMDTEH